MTKICRKCNIEKDINDYNKNKNNIDGYEIYCRSCRKESNMRYRTDNLDIVKSNQKEYYINKKLGIKKVKIVLPLRKVKCNLRSLISKAYRKYGYKKDSKTEQILGCSYEEFKTYLESKFEYWMTYDNYGLYNGSCNFGWDIDHITPLDSATDIEDMIKLNHYTNLRPLCSYTNRYLKRNKLNYV